MAGAWIGGKHRHDGRGNGGGRPIGFFAAAMGVNLTLALGTASILFAGVEV